MDENPEAAEKCNIHTVPTFKFFVSEKAVDEVVGAREAKIREKLALIN